MAATTVQDQATALLQQKVAEVKIRGAPAPDVEAAAILTSIATSLILNPKAVLYVANLARNGLLAALTSELTQVGLVRQDLLDLENISYEITDSSDLEKARIALLSVENQQKIAANNGSFTIYQNAVNDFLNNQLAQNVKKPGAPSLARPSQEAQTDLPTDFGLLQTLHADTLDRLYALAVGVQNFLSSPISTVVGLSTATRARQDIEDMISELQSDSSASSSRDFAVRLITAKAALGLLGVAPDITKPSLDTNLDLPTGYVVTGTSNETQANAKTSAGPFSFVSTDHLTADVNGNTTTVSSTTLFPAQNQPAVLSSAVTYPVTITSGQNLFVSFVADPSQTFSLQLDGTYTATTVALGTKWILNVDGTYSKTYRIPLTSGVRSLAQILTDINAVLSGIGNAVQLGSTNQILIYGFSNSPNIFFQRISIALISPNTSSPFYFANSAHATLGFSPNQFGIVGTSTDLTFASLEAFYSSLFNFVENTDKTISLSTLAATIGTTATFSGGIATTLGLAPSYLAVDNHVTFAGTVLGVATNPVNPIGLFDTGDQFVSSTGSSTVQSISATGITLSSSLPTFDGAVTINSVLYQTWVALNALVQQFLQTWLKTKYSSNLNVLDQAIAPLAGEITPALVNAALTIVSDLETQLTSMVTAISDPTTIIPSGGAANEADIINGIVALFTERKYDRAQDFFLELKIAEVFQMDWQTMSYGGSFLRAATDVARTDVQFINTTADGGTDVNGSQDRTGLPG